MTHQPVPPALLSWARLPGPAKALAAARRRLEAGHGMTGSALRVEFSRSEREQLGQLLGMNWAIAGRSVTAKALFDAVGSAGGELVALLVATDGPLRDLPAERAEAGHRAEAERRAASDVLVDAGVPATSVQAWLARRGLPSAGTGQLLRLADQAASVWRHLPRDRESPVLLQVLAAMAFPLTVLDRTHRLDRRTPLATAVLRLARGGGSDSDLPSGAEAWRAAWEELGVVCDPLSSRVLTLNLPLIGTAAACRLTASAAGEPTWLTWRSLEGEFTMAAGAQVFVCENPSIVAAAADRLGDQSRPLVCTDGNPSATSRRLLARLATSGAELLVRADDDASGQKIVADLRTLNPRARLWRYEQRSPEQAAAQPRFEEDDIEALLSDLVA